LHCSFFDFRYGFFHQLFRYCHGAYRSGGRFLRAFAFIRSGPGLQQATEA
jgi:hypothetical protein